MHNASENKVSQLARVVKKCMALPGPLQMPLLTLAIGGSVKFIRTAGIRCLALSHTRSVFFLKNKRKVRNHIGGIHAAAMALLAETATGMLMGMNLPRDKVAVIKSLHVDYNKRCQGDLTAVAVLSDAQIELIHSTEKGETTVHVSITDSEGKEPIQATMLWAWIPKVRKA